MAVALKWWCRTPTQFDHSRGTNLASIEQDAYNQTFPMVGAMKDIVHDFEMLNETQLRSSAERL